MDFNSSEGAVTWFRDRYREGTLVLKPPFQRKPVWAARQKCYLIESILLSLPVPEIFVQQTTSADGETSYAIVDGQQRIRAVLQFIGAETDPDESEHNKFALDHLDAGSRWKNATFSELSDAEKMRFYGYSFAIRYLKTEGDDDVRDMFRRLNKFLTPLNAQELRNATYVGPFIGLAGRLADNDYWVENRIVTPALIRRMNDIEFVSELLIGVLHGPQGGGDKVIDSYYEQYEDYETEFPEQGRARRVFVETMETIQRVLPVIRDTRWSNRTDYYTVFVSISHLLRTHRLPATKERAVARALGDFETQIDARVSDERAKVSELAVDYVRSVGRGSSDKSRRAARHRAILEVISEFFRARPSR